MNSLNLNSSTPDLAIRKPGKVIVPLAIGLSWGVDPDYVYEEKVDGRFETRRAHAGRKADPWWESQSLGETLLAGEYAVGEFYAFDLLKLHGEDCRAWPLRERLEWLDQVFHRDPLDCTGGMIHRVQSGKDGGKFLQAVLAAGGEGIVRKHLASPWGVPMEACKRLETFYCRVDAFNGGKQSVSISRLEHGKQFTNDDLRFTSGGEDLSARQSNIVDRKWAECGSVALFGGKIDRVRVGSIIKVEGFGLTREGKIREPRPCKDTPTSWLIQY